MTNQELIEKYKNIYKVNATLYSTKDKTGKTILLDGIVNPLVIDNRDLCSPIDNQGNTSECAAFSACTLAESIYWKRTGKLVQLDADHVYSLAKQYDGQVNADGTFLECALKALVNLHGLTTSDKVERFYNDRTQNTINTLKFLIHKYDLIQGGLNITTNWYQLNNNNYTVYSGGRPIGGHAIIICGYDETGFYICNSWGKSWAAKGFCIVPYQEFINEFIYAAYVTNVFNDMK